MPGMGEVPLEKNRGLAMAHKHWAIAGGGVEVGSPEASLELPRGRVPRPS